MNFSTTEFGRERRLAIPPDAHSSKERFLRVLNQQGFAVGQDDYVEVGRFFMAWLQQLKTCRSRVVDGVPYGWVISGNKLEGFAYGGRIHSPEAYDRPSPLADPVIQSKYEPTGSLDVWKGAANMITDQSRPALDMIIAASFGAPLMRFTGESGAVLSAYSTESGLGKSTAIKVGQAVWGSPKSVMTLNNTENAVGGNLTTLRNLPIYWDELKSHDRARFVTLIFQVAQGQGKARMRHDSTLRDPGSWNTMLLVGSNDSLVDAATNEFQTSPAEFYRLFEWRVDGTPFGAGTGDIARLTASLELNYGQAGLIYARFLGENHEQVARDMKRIHNELSSKLREGGGERFWFAACASILCGAIYANRLGLTQIDLKALAKYIQDTINRLRAYSKESAPDVGSPHGVSAITNRYLVERRARGMLVTDWVLMGPGRPRKLTIYNDTSKLESPVVQVGKKNRCMLISSADFRTWLRLNNISPSAVMEALQHHYKMKTVRAVMGKGTSYMSGRELLLEINIANTDLESWAGALEEESEAAEA